MNMLRITAFLILASVCNAQSDSILRVIQAANHPGLKLTENAGQWDAKILFKAQLDGGAMFMEKDGLTFNFYDKKKARSLHHRAMNNEKVRDFTFKQHAFRIKFENCNSISGIRKEQAGTDYENFFLGNDPSRWRGGVKNYHQVFLNELYDHIDYELITGINGIKYNFHVRPGGDPSRIALKYEGPSSVYLDKGVLHIKLEVNEGMEYRPYAYQMNGNGRITEVPCRYAFKNNRLSFEFPKGYDPSKELIIDPVLVFAAQSGSTADNFGMTATFDPQGNLYSGGTVFDSGYPVTSGAFNTSFSGTVYYGNSDVFITKYTSNGTTLVYSTYFGGGLSETVNSMIVDANGNLCFFGVTSSTDFPVTQGAYDNSFNGGTGIFFVYNGQRFVNGTDLYVAKLSSGGSSLIGCTYLGGSQNDGLNYTNHFGASYVVPAVPPSTAQVVVNEPAYDSLLFNYGDQCRGEIQLDLSGNIYIATCSRSSDFPMVNYFDNSLGGKQDGVVAKLNANLTSLLNSSFIGGSSNDACYGLIVKPNFEVYVTGATCSNNFPTTSGAYQTSFQGGNCDGFISRIAAGWGSLSNSTYFGTAQYDQSFFIQDDKYNNVYVYGQSLGSMPVVKATGSSTVYNNPGTHQFISRFGSSLGSVNMSLVFGHYTNSNVDISPAAFAVDKCNNIYISGWGGNLFNSNNPLTSMPLLNPTQSTTDGHDFYFMGLDSNAAALKYGSYFGGNLSEEHVDGGTSRFDPKGRIYQSVCAGCGGNDDFPVTSGAWPNTPGNPNHSSNCNNGVVKLDFQLQLVVATISTATLAGCAPLSLTFTNATPPTNSGATYLWHLGNGSVSTSSNPSLTYTAPGIYTVALVVNDNLTCNKRDSSITYITVLPKPSTTISANFSTCSNTVSFSSTSTGSLPSSPYSWNFGDGSPLNTQASPFYTYSSNGIFNVTFTVTDVNGCKDVKTTTVNVFNFKPGASSSASACLGAAITLTASGGTSYTWNPGGSNSGAITVSPVNSTTYQVQVLNNSSGNTCSKIFSIPVDIKPLPTAAFSTTTSPCSNTVQTLNQSGGNLPPSPYVWNFGDGSPNTTAQSPVHVYNTNGTYTIQLSVTDINGCASAKTATVNIFNFNPGVTPSASLCNGGSLLLQASGGTGYTWTPSSSLGTPSGNTTQATPSVTTIYSVEIENTTPGYRCAATLTSQVVVYPTPTAGFSYSLNQCGGGANFFDESSVDVIAWSWTLAPAVTKTVESPYYFYKDGGTFVVSLNSTNQYGCSNRISKTLTITPPPKLTVTGDSDVCYGNSLQLSASGGTAYSWSPPGTLDFPTIYNPKATPLVTTDYSVDITTTMVVNGETCHFILTTQAVVWKLSSTPVSASANPPVIIVGNSSTLIYVGDPGATVSWFPVTNLSPITGYTVKASPERPTTYTAVATRGPCRQDVEVHVDAFTEGCLTKDVFIPNTFTPNNDNQNDVLFVRGLKVDEVYFAVYNRWGQMMFETKDKEKGWDGVYNGKPAEVGVYGWYLKVKCFNGEETFKKGNVTLVR